MIWLLLCLLALGAAMLPLLGRAIVEPAEDDSTGGDVGHFGG